MFGFAKTGQVVIGGAKTAAATLVFTESRGRWVVGGAKTAVARFVWIGGGWWYKNGSSKARFGRPGHLDAWSCEDGGRWVVGGAKTGAARLVLAEPSTWMLGCAKTEAGGWLAVQKWQRQGSFAENRGRWMVGGAKTGAARLVLAEPSIWMLGCAKTEAGGWLAVQKWQRQGSFAENGGRWMVGDAKTGVARLVWQNRAPGCSVVPKRRQVGGWWCKNGSSEARLQNRAPGRLVLRKWGWVVGGAKTAAVRFVFAEPST